MVKPNQPLLPLPNQRKSRDKSPPPSSSIAQLESNRSHHLTSRHINNNFTINPNSSSLSVPCYQTYGDSYEFGSSDSSFSRAIDFTGSEPYRQQATNFVYYTVQPSDTLQNLSVRYSCPVASIKRLNNLWSDQEFYGLTRIKLPAGRLKLIADVIDEETIKAVTETQEATIEQPHSSWANNESFESIANPTHFTYRNVDKITPVISNNFRYDETNLRESDSIFKDYDLNIEKARTAARCYNDNASAIMQSLAQSGNNVDDDEDSDDPNKIARREAQRLLNDMSDYGLSYNGLILFVFIVCLICPLAYVIYLEETHHDTSKAL